MSKQSTIKSFCNSEIPSDWVEVKLGDLIDKIVGGGTPRRENSEFWNGNIFWATVKDFTSYNPNTTEEKITDKGLKNSSSNLIPKGTLITATRMALGKVMSYNIDVAINQDLKAIFPSKELDNKFLFYWFQKNVSVIEGLGNGSTVKGITLDDLKAINFYKIPIIEQKAIAKVLGKADAAIHTTEKLIIQKEHRKKWLMQQLLTGKKRLKGFCGEWKKERLEKYLVKHDEKSTVNNQYPVLTSSRRGIFLQSDYYTRDVASEDNTGYNVVPRDYFTYRHMSDDLIFKFNINDIVDRGIVSTLYPVFTTKDINSYFLLVKLNEGYEFKMHAEEQKQGGSRTYVYFKTLCNLKLNLPSIEEQTAIAHVLQAADKEISLLKAKAEKLREQKKGLMQVLLTGKVRLKIN